MAGKGDYVVRENTWSRSFKDQVVWFGFAVLLAFGGSYISSQSTTVKIKSDIQELQRRIDNTESNTEANSKELDAIQKDIVRVEQKLNALLKDRDIDYRNVGVQDRDR